MLAARSTLWYTFNPLTVYWCEDARGHLACVVAEVRNTRGGRHCYVFRHEQDDIYVSDKVFPVSPFFPVDGKYRMRLPLPSEQVDISVALFNADGRRVLSARLRGRIIQQQALRVRLAEPFVSLNTIIRIRRRGIALYFRRLRRYAYPTQVPEDSGWIGGRRMT
jgi:DUF1365 family protein